MLWSVADVPLICCWRSGALDIAPCLAIAAALSVRAHIIEGSFFGCETLGNVTQITFATSPRRPLDICTSCEACRKLKLGRRRWLSPARLPITNAFMTVNVRRICYGDSSSLRLYMSPGQKLQFWYDRPTQYYCFGGSHHYRCHWERQVPSYHN